MGRRDRRQNATRRRVVARASSDPRARSKAEKTRANRDARVDRRA
jgi:hypothetical protein